MAMETKYVIDEKLHGKKVTRHETEEILAGLKLWSKN